MNLVNRLKYLLAGPGVIPALFLSAGLLDIILASLFARFYSMAAFIVSFGVGGIFAGVFCYSAAISRAAVKNEMARWSIILMMITTGAVSFFFLSVLEGGEYEAAFKSFGVTLSLTSLLFVKGKVEIQQ